MEITTLGQTGKFYFCEAPLAARTGWDRKPWLKKNPYPQLKIMAVVAARRQRLSILAVQAIEILQKEKLLMRVDCAG